MDIGQTYSVSQKEFFISNQSLTEDKFKFLTVEGENLQLAISVMNPSPHSSKIVMLACLHNMSMYVSRDSNEMKEQDYVIKWFSHFVQIFVPTKRVF